MRRSASICSVFALALLLAGCGDSETTPTVDGPVATHTQPKPPDTGRMSEDEYDRFKRAHQRFVSEVTQYGEGLSGKCAAILSAGQAAEFLDCENSAFDGMAGAFGGIETWEDLQDDVAKTCLASLRTSTKAFSDYADAIFATHDLASRGQLSAPLLIEAQTRFVAGRRDRYLKRYRLTSSSCSPTPPLPQETGPGSNEATADAPSQTAASKALRAFLRDLGHRAGARWAGAIDEDVTVLTHGGRAASITVNDNPSQADLQEVCEAAKNYRTNPTLVSASNSDGTTFADC